MRARCERIFFVISHNSRWGWTTFYILFIGLQNLLRNPQGELEYSFGNITIAFREEVSQVPFVR